MTAFPVPAALGADPPYYYRHLAVRVDNGMADLSGYHSPEGLP
jgi:hypothetical protein